MQTSQCLALISITTLLWGVDFFAAGITSNQGGQQSQKQFVQEKPDDSFELPTHFSDPQPIDPPNEPPAPLDLVAKDSLGVIDYSVNVTDDGEAAISVPLVLPPGRLGVVPSISLEYNSRKGDGIAGIGWKLAVGSSISRCGSSYVRDGINRRVMLSNDLDHFCLDGKPLVRLPDGTYRTEVETYTKIVAYNMRPGTFGPTHFIAHTKEGKRIRYGCGDNEDDVCASSVMKLRKWTGGGYVLVPTRWAISEVRDENGNYMRYLYNREENQSHEVADPDAVHPKPAEHVEMVLSEIWYTGNDVVSPAVSAKALIHFGYESRSSVGALLRHGFRLENRTLLSRLLTSVTMYMDYQLVRYYQFKYESNLVGEPRLISISEHDGQGKSKVPLRFEWSPEETRLFRGKRDSGYPVPTYQDKNEVGYYPNTPLLGDVDGNGLADMIFVQKDTWRILFNRGDRHQIYEGANEGTHWYLHDTGIVAGSLPKHPDDEAETYLHWGLQGKAFGAPIDYNQDGLTDVLLFPINCERTWSVLQSTGDSFVKIDTGAEIYVDPDNYHPHDADPHNPYRSNSWPDDQPDELPGCFYHRIKGADKLASTTYVFDFNGDGLRDLLFIWKGRQRYDCGSSICSVAKRHVHYRLLTESGFGPPQTIAGLSGAVYSPSAVEEGHAVGVPFADHFLMDNSYFFMDVDGDGTTEFMVGDTDEEPVLHYLAYDLKEGSYTWTETQLPFINAMSDADGYFTVRTFPSAHTKVADINGDGLHDVIFVYRMMQVPNDGCFLEGSYCIPCPEDGCMRAWINMGGGKFIGGESGLPAIDHSWYAYYDFFTYSRSFDFDGNRTMDILFPAIPLSCPVDDLLSRYVIRTSEQGKHIRNCGGLDILLGSTDFISDRFGEIDGWGEFSAIIGPPINERHILPQSDWISYAGDGSNSYFLRPMLLDATGDLSSEIWISLNMSGPDNVRAPVPDFTMYLKRLKSRNRIVKIRDSRIGIDPDFSGTPNWNETWSYRFYYMPTTNPGVYDQAYDYSITQSDGLARHECDSPQQCINPRKLVVYKLRKDGGLNNDEVVTTYKYHDSRYDAHWGWLGFGQRTATTDLTRTAVTTFYDNITFDPEIDRYPYRGKKTLIVTQTLIGSTQARKTYKKLTYGTQRHNIGATYSTYLDEETTDVWHSQDGAETWANLKTLRRDYEVDLYGYVTLETSLIEGTDIRDEKRVLYYDNLANWTFGLPIDVQEWSRGDNGETEFRHSTVSYYPDTRRIKEKIREPGDPDLRLVQRFDYDNFGNIYKTTKIASYLDYRISVTEYDADGIFVTKTINPLGHVLITTYYRGLGLPSTTLDSNGLATLFQYNTFGEPLKIVHPDGTETNTRYQTVLNSCGHKETLIEVSKEGFPTTKATFNRLGLRVRDEKIDWRGNWLKREYTYDSLRRQVEASYPDMRPVANYLFTEYDELGRVISMRELGVSSIELVTEYSGLTVTEYDGEGNSTTKVYGKDAKVHEVIDALGNRTRYEYGPFGTLRRIVDGGLHQTTMDYDAYNSLTCHTDPDTGATTYTYDGFDQKRAIHDSLGRHTNLFYDKLGRLTNKTSSIDGESTFTYDTHFIGKLSSSQSGWGHTRAYLYDAFGRVERKQVTIDGSTFETRFEYDDKGRLWQEHYPQSFFQPVSVQYSYSPIGGYLSSLETLPDNKAYWELLETDEIGRMKRFHQGATDGLETIIDYWNGMMEVEGIRVTDGVQDLMHTKYWYDDNKQVTTRHDYVARVHENFTYDPLNRLISNTVEGEGLFTSPSGEPIDVQHSRIEYQYDVLGNVTYKSDVGFYTYSRYRPHLVEGIKEFHPLRGWLDTRSYTHDEVGNMVARPEETITFTSFNLPHAITHPDTEQGVVYEYDAENTRVFRAAHDRTVYYFDEFELVVAGSQSIAKYNLPQGAILIRKGRQGRPPVLESVRLEFVHTDLIGSTNMITSESGDILQRTYFDPFGGAHEGHWRGPEVKVDQNDYAYGFAGHEHDEDLEMNLINMKGRIYDPEIGRFLSADPIVIPQDGQGLNRFSYVRNNPVNRTDSSGFCEDGPCESVDFYDLSWEEQMAYDEAAEAYYQDHFIIDGESPSGCTEPEAYFDDGQDIGLADVDVPVDTGGQGFYGEVAQNYARIRENPIWQRAVEGISALNPVGGQVAVARMLVRDTTGVTLAPPRLVEVATEGRTERQVNTDRLTLDILQQVFTVTGFRSVARGSGLFNTGRGSSAPRSTNRLQSPAGRNSRENPTAGDLFERAAGNATTQIRRMSNSEFSNFVGELGRTWQANEAAAAAVNLSTEGRLALQTGSLQSRLTPPTAAQMEKAAPAWRGDFRGMTVIEVPGYGTVYPAWRGRGARALPTVVNQESGFVGPNFYPVAPNVFRGLLQRFVTPAFGR